jgi:hypothetical protein
MEKSSKRGKIPQSDWPLIMARYDAGETLASIARTYDCSPPAISYVVSRSRARQPSPQTPPPAPAVSAPQLIKAEAATNGIAKPPPAAAPPANAPLGAASLAKAPVRRDESLPRPEAPAASPTDRRGEMPPREANGFVRDGTSGRDATLPGMAPSAAPQLPRIPTPAGNGNGSGNGDARRTLHLSLGTAPSPGNGATHPVEPAAERHNFASFGQPVQSQTAGERPTPSADRGAPHSPAAPDHGRDGAAGASFAESRPTTYYGPVQQTGNEGARRKDGGGPFIDKELRARVDGDIAAFLTAFDAALVEDTQDSRSALREATDRLLRAGARTRIELERLEARLPLPPRDGNGRGEAAWRHR